MKTLYQYPPNSPKIRDRLRILQDQTGVKWTTYHIGNGQVFLPQLSKWTPVDETAARAILPYIPKATPCGGLISFAKLAELSGLSLPQVLAGAKWLIKHAGYMPEIGRTVATVAIYKPFKP